MSEEEKTPSAAERDAESQSAQDAGCTCIERINDFLRRAGSKARLSLDTIARLDSDTLDERVGIKWESAAGGGLLRQGPSQFAAKFCPFCGKAYPSND